MPSSLSLPSHCPIAATLLYSTSAPHLAWQLFSRHAFQGTNHNLSTLRQGTTLKMSSQEPSFRTIADAALPSLSNSDQPSALPEGPANPPLALPASPNTVGKECKDALQPPVPSIELTTTNLAQSERFSEHEAGDLVIPKFQQGPAAPRILPSLLRYVDFELMQNVTFHDQIPNPYATCCICTRQWTQPANLTQDAENPQAAITSTFLPLSPCGHWAHYRCLIWLSTRNDARRNTCPACNTLLYHWEGIAALTLATRTGIPMDSIPASLFHLPPYTAYTVSARMAYETDCTTIASIIEKQFFQHLSKPSKQADHSPDLVQCCYDALQELQQAGRPASEWLQYSTQTGYILWCMLVKLKMRRFLVEGHARIMETQAWRAFEEGGKVLQGQILGEVRG